MLQGQNAQCFLPSGQEFAVFLMEVFRSASHFQDKNNVLIVKKFLFKISDDLDFNKFMIIYSTYEERG